MGATSRLDTRAEGVGAEEADAYVDALSRLFPNASRTGITPQDHWIQGTPLVEHGPVKNLEEGIAERFPTPQALAEFDPEMIVSVYGFRDGETAPAGAGVRDLYTFPPQPVREAVRLYEEGHTVIAWRMLNKLPEAHERATDILAAVGMPRDPLSSRGLKEPWSSASPFVVSLVYSPGGQASGLGLHYDRFDSVVVHMRGTKRWRLGVSPHLSYPLWNEEAAAQLDYPPSLPRIATRTDQVDELEDVTLHPGSALLLPRGTYHTTLADDEASLSIGYHFALPTWCHLLVAALEQRLSRDPFFRTTPFGAFSPDGPSDAAKQVMQEVAERAQGALGDPTDLLEGLLGDLASHHQAVFRATPVLDARLKPGDPASIVDYAGSGVQIELPPGSGPLCRWLVDMAPAAFEFGDALRASGERLSPRAVWDLLQEAVEAGVLERRWGRRPDDTTVPTGA